MPVILWIVIVLVTSVFLWRWLKKQEKGVSLTAGTAPAAVGNGAYQAQPIQATAAAPSVLSTEERLSLCKDLLSAGAITPEEYESRKQQILVQESR